MRVPAAVLTVLAAVATVGTGARASAEETSFRVVVHPANPADAVTRKALSELFLKRTTRWPDGAEVHPVEPPEHSTTRAHFRIGVIGKSALAVKMFWSRRVSEGHDAPPLEKQSDDDVVAYVRATPGAIGYVSPGTNVSGVKVLPVSD